MVDGWIDRRVDKRKEDKKEECTKKEGEISE